MSKQTKIEIDWQPPLPEDCGDTLSRLHEGRAFAERLGVELSHGGTLLSAASCAIAAECFGEAIAHYREERP